MAGNLFSISSNIESVLALHLGWSSTLCGSHGDSMIVFVFAQQQAVQHLLPDIFWYYLRKLNLTKVCRRRVKAFLFPHSPENRTTPLPQNHSHPHVEELRSRPFSAKNDEGRASIPGFKSWRFEDFEYPDPRRDRHVGRGDDRLAQRISIVDIFMRASAYR